MVGPVGCMVVPTLIVFGRSATQRTVLKRKIKLVLSIGYLMIERAGQLSRRFLGQPIPGRCVVLYYHAIPRSDQRNFARQMQELRLLANPVPAGAVTALEPGDIHAALTFDDAFRSVVEHGLPALVENQIPFTIFVPTERLGEHPNWEMDPASPDANEVIMTAEELISLPENLADVGSHTRTHPRLTKLSDAAVRSELEDSRADLERQLSRPIDLLAFPYGDRDERIVELCREAGYRRVFHIDPGVTSLRPDDYVTPRVPVSASDSILEFRLKVLGAYSWMPWASALKRRFSRPRSTMQERSDR